MQGSTFPDVAVVGGGIIGAAVAEALARHGIGVTVLERDRIGAHASGGAAGILSTRDDEPGTPFHSLCRASLALYPERAAALLEETGIDVEYQREGILALLRPEEMRRPVPPDAVLLDRHQLRALEPDVAPDWAGAYMHPNEGQVNAGRMTRALAEAAARRGVRFHEGVQVTGLLREGARVTGVRTTGGDIPAGRVVIAAGPWSGLLAPALGRSLPVFPVKGQIVWGRTLPVSPRRPVFAGCYIVPKRELGIAIGATQELAGFSETPTLGGAAEMISRAADAFPHLMDAEFVRIWSSVRPGTPDGLPLLGPVSDAPGLILATGHFAYGIANSLITGLLVKNWILEQPQPVDTGAFRVERFG